MGVIGVNNSRLPLARVLEVVSDMFVMQWPLAGGETGEIFRDQLEMMDVGFRHQ